jgi:penicillin-binding protein 2
MKPHLVREVMDVETKHATLVAKEPIGQLPLTAENLEVIRKALVGVNIEGTSATSFAGAPYTSGGKTGTAQVFTVKQNEKYNASRIDERMRDHALFIAFAPAEDPKVALAMVVENAGFGAQSAAPIARRVFDYVLMGQYPSVEDIEAVRNGQATRPIGKPRPIASVPWPPKAVVPEVLPPDDDPVLR